MWFTIDRRPYMPLLAILIITIISILFGSCLPPQSISVNAQQQQQAPNLIPVLPIRSSSSLSSLSSSTTTAEPQFWNKEVYPNPLTQARICQRYPADKSLICDPDLILSKDQADSLDKILFSMSNATHHCFCQICSTEDYGIQVAVALAKNIFQKYNSPTSNQEFANYLNRNWNFGLCNNTILILMVTSTNQITTVLGSVAEKIFNGGVDFMSDLMQQTNIQTQFKQENYYEGLRLILVAIRSFVASREEAPGFDDSPSSGNRAIDGGDSNEPTHHTALAVVGIIIGFILVLFVIIGTILLTRKRYTAVETSTDPNVDRPAGYWDNNGDDDGASGGGGDNRRSTDPDDEVDDGSDDDQKKIGKNKNVKINQQQLQKPLEPQNAQQSPTSFATPTLATIDEDFTLHDNDDDDEDDDDYENDIQIEPISPALQGDDHHQQQQPPPLPTSTPPALMSTHGGGGSNGAFNYEPVSIIDDDEDNDHVQQQQRPQPQPQPQPQQNQHSPDTNPSGGGDRTKLKPLIILSTSSSSTSPSALSSLTSPLPPPSSTTIISPAFTSSPMSPTISSLLSSPLSSTMPPITTTTVTSTTTPTSMFAKSITLPISNGNGNGNEKSTVKVNGTDQNAKTTSNPNLYTTNTNNNNNNIDHYHHYGSAKKLNQSPNHNNNRQSSKKSNSSRISLSEVESMV